jgi:hypothetical protein
VIRLERQAITGIRSKEFSGAGYNQFVLDDTDA